MSPFGTHQPPPSKQQQENSEEGETAETKGKGGSLRGSNMYVPTEQRQGRLTASNFLISCARHVADSLSVPVEVGYLQRRRAPALRTVLQYKETKSRNGVRNKSGRGERDRTSERDSETKRGKRTGPEGGERVHGPKIASSKPRSSKGRAPTISRSLG